VDNGAEEDRERDGSTSSSTIWRTCSSTWRMPRIGLNGEGEPVWLRDPQPEGERVYVCHVYPTHAEMTEMQKVKYKFCNSTIARFAVKVPITKNLTESYILCYVNNIIL